jgi:TatD family-associated radical SAM protein
LWLAHEPTGEELIAALKAYDLAEFSEVVYCGYGEPFSSYEVMLDVARWLKKQTGCPPVRINTNGLGDLIVGRHTAPELQGLVDSLSISLNAPTSEDYVQLCNPVFGLDALPAIIAFTREAKAYVPEVVLTVVDILSPQQLEACHRIAADIGVPLRIRNYV